MYRVDLNCDLGESFGAYRMGNDEEILTFISSANIACGYHAGDPSTMRHTVQMALEKGVAIGAHPGLPDLIGFGRRTMDISQREAHDIVLYQMGALHAFVKAQGGIMHHVKPHGALYNMAAQNDSLAEAIAEAVYSLDTELILYGLSGSRLVKAAEKIGLRSAHEVFADRTYQIDGSLTSRRQPNAVLTDTDEAVSQVIRMVKEGKVTSQQGTDVMIKADTVCIHGDGVHALSFAKQIRSQLENEQITIEMVSQQT
ncbi:5-oxoprolinase subunit PxpA [Brevibacterium sp. JNUCC-42]|nr:5-oxoprolinase subunit PxpA [Brevibacterium sp. JNUCC-42]